VDFWAVLINVIKALVIAVGVITVVPILVWFERRGAGWIQNRRGPNRILKGKVLGLVFPLADAIKFAFKEDIIPDNANRFYYILAPLVMIIAAVMAFAVIPFAPTAPLPGVALELPPVIHGVPVPFMAAPIDIGILYIFAVLGLGVYGIVMAGWASNSNYAMLGALRSTAQMISYEISLTLSIVGVLMMAGTVDLNRIVVQQSQSVWYVVPQILGFIVFITAAFAETNRLPFDLPEGESEIVAGYHVEYGSMKFMLFYFAEYIAIVTTSMLIVTLYFGGWSFPGIESVMNGIGDALRGSLGETGAAFVANLVPITVLLLKSAFFMVLFVWVRWTLPRFRYDQLMRLGWKVLLPLALVNIVLTGLFML